MVCNNEHKEYKHIKKILFNEFEQAIYYPSAITCRLNTYKNLAIFRIKYFIKYENKTESRINQQLRHVRQRAE